MEEEWETCILYGLICGPSFMRTLWDPNLGDVIEVERTNKEGEIFIDGDGNIVKDKILLGEASSRAISAFNLIPGDELCSKMKDQPWIMERQWLSIKEAEKIFPHLKGQITETTDQKTDYECIMERLTTPMTSGLNQKVLKKNDALNQEVLLKTMWMKPNNEYDNGVVIAVLGDHLAMIDDYPNNVGSNMYPYAKFDERNDGFHFWGQSTIERLVPIQKAYNKLRQKKLKNIILMGNGKYLLPKGSQVQEDALTDEAGEVIEYNRS